MEMNQALEPPDCHYLSAAIGWLELGNPAEAELELEHIQPENVDREVVLDVRWQLYQSQALWGKALETATRMRQLYPNEPAGYIHSAYAMRRTEGGGLVYAWNILAPAAELFPKEPIIPYNLACYAAQLGKLDRAWELLEQAMDIGTKSVIRKMALVDPDLTALWPRLKGETSSSAET